MLTHWSDAIRCLANATISDVTWGSSDSKTALWGLVSGGHQPLIFKSKVVCSYTSGKSIEFIYEEGLLENLATKNSKLNIAIKRTWSMILQYSPLADISNDNTGKRMEWSSCDRKVAGSIPALPICRSVVEQDTELPVSPTNSMYVCKNMHQHLKKKKVWEHSTRALHENIHLWVEMINLAPIFLINNTQNKPANRAE